MMKLVIFAALLVAAAATALLAIYITGIDSERISNIVYAESKIAERDATIVYLEGEVHKGNAAIYDLQGEIRQRNSAIAQQNREIRTLRQREATLKATIERAERSYGVNNLDWISDIEEVLEPFLPLIPGGQHIALAFFILRTIFTFVA